MVSDRHALLGGSAAGFVVDIALFPIDTIKTRMQSKQGLRSLGLSDLHKLKGVGAAAVGSMPGSALFFLTYEHVKRMNPGGGITQHMMASSLGEIVACFVRVPTEVVKQRVQAKLASSSWAGLRDTLAHSGLRGLYVGYGTTVMRFPLLQFSTRYGRSWEQPITLKEVDGNQECLVALLELLQVGWRLRLMLWRPV